MSSPEAFIAIRNLSKSFNSHQVLSDISCEFSRGLTHVILGSSGGGKSTLLRLLMGLIRPDDGEVEIAGQKLTPETQRTLVRKIGYVVQDGGLFPHLSASENITLVAKNMKWSREKILERLTELCELVGLNREVLDQFPVELSGGQKQRVSLMRALMLDPEILLLDEPLAALDPIIRFGLQQELKRIFNRVKKTVIIVTHDLSEAAFFGHTITLINAGKIEQCGAFEDLVLRPKTPFVREFIQAQRPLPELKVAL